ncbi:MAG: type III pantothenate kinase [Candidatus Omnitrophota bacterium]
MKLLIDIGNTNTSIAVVRKEKILARYFIHTNKKEIREDSLKRLFGRYIPYIEKIIIVSVVPRFCSMFEKRLERLVAKALICVVGRDKKVPVKVKYKKPREVGQDRLVGAYAAFFLYQRSLVIIDFGTAVTFDYVNKKGEYEGGLIFPGLRLALGALIKNTALLPEIEIKPVKGMIGKDTRSSMNKGLIFGYAAMCDGLVRYFKKEYGTGIKVVATGGDAQMISGYSSCIDEVCQDLVFKGLILLLR